MRLLFSRLNVLVKFLDEFANLESNLIDIFHHFMNVNCAWQLTVVFSSSFDGTVQV